MTESEKESVRRRERQTDRQTEREREREREKAVQRLFHISSLHGFIFLQNIFLTNTH